VVGSDVVYHATRDSRVGTVPSYCSKGTLFQGTNISLLSYKDTRRASTTAPPASAPRHPSPQTAPAPRGNGCSSRHRARPASFPPPFPRSPTDLASTRHDPDRILSPPTATAGSRRRLPLETVKPPSSCSVSPGSGSKGPRGFTIGADLSDCGVDPARFTQCCC
jgi:hypothetical protein